MRRKNFNDIVERSIPLKAFILKDFYVMQSQIKLLFFAISPFFIGDEVLLLSFSMGVCIVQATYSITSDEKCNWDQFANIFPIRKSVVIKSKYLFSLLLVLSLILILFPILMITKWQLNTVLSYSIFPTLRLFFSTIILFLSVLLPFYIKFGAQIGHIFLLIFGFIPLIGRNLLYSYEGDGYLTILFDLLDHVVTPVFALVFFYLSYKISALLYEKKEF